MICKDDRSTFISVGEYLGFHAVKAKLNRLFVGRQLSFQNVLQVLFDYRFNRQRRNIAGTANRHRNTPNSAAVLKEAFIHQLCNVAQNRIVTGVGDHIPVKNKLPGVFQI